MGHGLFLGAALLGVALTLITEGLSLFHAVERGWLVVSWGGAAGIGLWILRRRRVKPAPVPLIPRPALAATGSILAVTAAIAVLAPPNNWDSMTYHMPRVTHWAQAASVAHYPTHILRQLWLGPGAEFAILHLYALAGGDRLANLVQWLAFAGCVVGSAAVAGALGGGPWARGLAAVACATLPMAISQASSTQNDLVGSFWLLSLGYWVLRFRAAPRASDAILIGVSAGLAALTKLPVAFLTLPWLVAFVVAAGTRGVRRAPGYLLAGGMVVVLLNAGHVIRTIPLLSAGTPARAAGVAESADRLPPDWAMYVNTTLDPRAIASNALRNATLHLTVPSSRVNGWLEWAVLVAHRAMGFDPNDRRTTLAGPFPAYRVGPFLLHEDFVGNPLHFVAAFVAGAVVWRRRGAFGDSARLWATLSAATGLAFVVALKWQPWNSRLHLPLFILACPLIGVAFEGRRRLVAAWTAAFCLLAVPILLLTWPRTLVGEGSVVTTPRVTQRFRNHPQLQPLYETAADLVRDLGCQRVGLVLDWDSPEYPLWPLLQARLGQGVRVEHSLVENASARLAPPFVEAPCALIVVGRQPEGVLAWRGRTFVERWGRAPVQVYAPAPAPASSTGARSPGGSMPGGASRHGDRPLRGNDGAPGRARARRGAVRGGRGASAGGSRRSPRDDGRRTPRAP